jgi:NADPH:quinone reductase-like Zn-dependent oxidoreductase
MRAVRFHAHGGREVLQVDEIPDPEPRAGEVLIRVHGCALNHLDVFLRNGIPGVPLPHTVGSDVAGEVVASTVSSVPEGLRVMVQPGLSCRRCPACLSGQDNLCPVYDVLGYRSEGGYAELVTIPAVNVIPLPDAIGFREAAAFTRTSSPPGTC